MLQSVEQKRLDILLNFVGYGGILSCNIAP